MATANPAPAPALNAHHRRISFADLERTFRATTGPMVPPPHPNPAQAAAYHAAQRQETQRQHDTTRRLSRKPTDRCITPELSDVVIGNGVEEYTRLREVERQLDAIMMRKRLDVSDNLQRRYARREGVLRVWIRNWAEGQPWQVVEEERREGGGLVDGGWELGAEEGSATFRVRIEGRLLDQDDDDDAVEEGEGGKKQQQRLYFSNFFSAIRIEFARNPTLQPDAYTSIEWKKPVQSHANPSYDPHAPEVQFDALEFERKADENIPITILLWRAAPHPGQERFRLSPALAEVLDADEEDRAGAVEGVWEYCRLRGLLDEEDRRLVRCDDRLQKLFNRETLHFPTVPELLTPHLQPLPPIRLTYTIRVDRSYIVGPPASAPTIYDLRLPLPNPLIPTLTRLHKSPTHLNTLTRINTLDDELALLVQKVNNTNAKRKFFDQLSRDPVGFLGRWIGSQRRDLEVLMAEEGEAAGRKAGGWDGPEVWEGVGGWLARKGGH